MNTRLLPVMALGVAILLPPAGFAQEPRKPDPSFLFRLADTNKDGKLSPSEFLKLMERNPRFKDNPDLARQAFDRLDTQKSGFLTLQEFSRIAPGNDANPFRKNNLPPTDSDKVKPSSETRTVVRDWNDQPTAEQVAFFEKKIRPVLVDQCYSCHSSEKPDKLKGGLLLDTRMGLRAGGDTGPSMVPGNARQSLLVKAMHYKDENLQMPPKGKLPDQVIADFEQWIAMGAPDPRSGEKVAANKSEIDIEKGKRFWSYQLPKASAAPAVKDSSWAWSEIDRHVLAGLEAKGLKPVSDADARTLVRRLHLDLTGLPPSPEATENFVFEYARDAQKAVANRVDELLASPQFGERWGRHWLDVARFAESSGKTVNFHFPHAWRYRDYVISAFNADKPFDRFIKEQIAGDLLPHGSEKDQAENIIATGFLQVGAKNLNERNRLQFELDLVDEQIDTVTQAFLGQTAACARCHDHKFDAIPTRDYYALAGIFRSTDNLYGTVRFVQAVNPTSLHTLPKGSAPTILPPLTAKEREAIEKSNESLQESIRSQSDPIRNLFAIGNLELNRAKLNLYEKDGTPKVLAMGCRDRYRTVDSEIFQRGEPDRKGEVVPRGVLQVVGGPKVSFDRKSSGRLQLAEWIASPENPLTARVYVNRVWLHLFGRGIVATPDNFGTTGTAPSNPALLDHLALQFMEQDWSTKKLVRSLVLTHVYQLDSKFDEANFVADPDNSLLWRMTPRRLEAEAVRDSILAVSGRLQTEAPVGSPVAKAGDGPANRPAFGNRMNVNADNTHRAVYLPIVRDNLPEVLSLFDAADSNMVIGDRPNTTVPAQSLFMMNNPFVIRNADATAERLMSSSSSDSERIRQAYLLFYSRPPSEKELAKAEEFLKTYPATRRFSKREPWAALCQAMFGSAEFLMRK